MATPRKAWGIDIGNRALKAVKLNRDAEGRLHVSDFELIEHETPLSNAGDNRDSLIQSALANFVQRRPEKGASIGVSVSGSSSLARFIKLPPVEPKKIPEIVRFEAIQQIPFPLDEVEWSYQLFQTPDSPEVEVGIFAMRQELINQHLKFFTDVGLKIECVQLNPLAVYNAMQYDGKIDGCTMIVDLGSENTDLIIADGETIWLRSIPIGGKNFTDILTKQFKLPFAKAEDLKRTAASSKYAKQIFQAMRPVFADLVAEVQRSIGFYASTHKDSTLKRVLALGGTFKLPGLQKYLQQNLQIEVARVDHLEAGGPEDAKQRGAFEENLLSMASAYGLAIQAMGDAKITSSLLPAAIRRQKMWNEKIPWFAATAACFVAGTGVALGSYFLGNLQYGQNEQSRDQTHQIYNSGKTLSDSWSNDVETQGTEARQRIANVQSMLTFRRMWPSMLADIQNCLPVPPTEIPKNRAEWKTIWIDSITSGYDTDLSKIPSIDANAPAPPGGVAGGMNPLPGLTAIGIPAGSHGFRLTIDVITPFGGDPVEGYQYVYNNFIANLKNLQAAQTKDGKVPGEYLVVYVNYTRRQSVKDDTTYSTQLRTRIANFTAATQPSGGAAIAGYGVPPAGFAAPAAAAQQLLDPRNGQDMSNDTVVEVAVLVMTGPPGTITPPTPVAATPAAVPAPQ